MKTTGSALIALLATGLLGCSQGKTVELPLSLHYGYGPFGMSSAGFGPRSYNEEGDPWRKTYPKISTFPEGLTDMQWDHIETNIFQSVYQDHLLGNITKDWYETLRTSWDWTPDTVNLSKDPVKTKIAVVWGKDPEGTLKIAVDANNNLDLNDDRLFSPIDLAYAENNPKQDSILRANTLDVCVEIFTGNRITPVSVPLLVTYSDMFGMFFYNFPQYATATYKGEPIAVSSGFGGLSYVKDIEVAYIPGGREEDRKAKDDEIYEKEQFMEIEGEILKIVGVDGNRNVLVLEKTDLPKTQLLSSQTGYRLYPFEGEEFTTKAPVSSESLSGKYVLLDFWATWCQPCIQEFPHLRELYAKTDRSKFEIVGIVGESQTGDLAEAIEKYGIGWPQVFSDNTNRIKEGFKVPRAYPTTLLIDPEGIVVAKDLGGEELEETILGLIGE